ncbi:MAG: DUF1570 domain-containing protein [Aureliella sp.]
MMLGNTCVLAQGHPILEVTTHSGNVSGLPIHWGSDAAVLLKPAGEMLFLNQREIVSHRRTRESFRPASQAAVRARMQNELGDGYETLISGPYVIAAPRGNVNRWKTRFDSLLSGYFRYFGVRDWRLEQADFPLQVYVLGSREQFVAYSARNGASAAANTIGSYFPDTNVCIMYELPGLTGTDWSETEATIVHEAVHQLAFNTGVHERLFENPLWCVEGLATLFEEPSVYDPRASSSTVATRINDRQAKVVEQFCRRGGKLEDALAQIVGSDDMFGSDPQLAYASAWALTFYLTERMPRQYMELMRAQQSRGFGHYPTRSRIGDFQNVVNVPMSTLSLQVKRLLSIQ